MNRIALGKKGNGQLLNVDVIISGLNSRLSDSLWDILLVRTLIDFKLNKKEGVTEYKSFYHFLVNARLPSLRTNRKDMRTEASSWSLVFILVCGNGVVLNQEG